MAEAAQNVTGPLALLHPRLVVFGDSISSVRGTSLVVRKALRLTHLVRVQHGLAPCLSPSTLSACRHRSLWHLQVPYRCELCSVELPGQ